MTVSVDASVILKCLTPEPDSPAALSWLEAHRSDEIVAPWLLMAEVASVLRKKALRGEITCSEGLEALDLLAGLGIRLLTGPGLARRAFELAAVLNLPSAYDTLYLAAAEAEGCELWTADRRFAGLAAGAYTGVRLLGPPK